MTVLCIDRFRFCITAKISREIHKQDTNTLVIHNLRSKISSCTLFYDVSNVFLFFCVTKLLILCEHVHNK